ncbi:double zinc ribbon domain-containing protein [Halovivax cerinus]|uniref:Zinc ribbon domain-containing protein n=1 Tax=Halovivax cerinus TaxID=1487865 RepID=A0ABD5NLH3_9EURY|nr:zinc-ribbon domain-containing protein [Halovivax cerinus]
MGKITFRADDDLVDELESFDTSKSEVMREALRSYLGRSPPTPGVQSPASSSTDDSTGTSASSLDDVLENRIDDAITDRLDRTAPTDVRLQITVDSECRSDRSLDASDAAFDADDPSDAIAGFDEVDPSDRRTCSQCGTDVRPSHVYCPNCGEKMAGRVFCECGSEVRSDWAFCPSCGRRTPAADVLDSA